ncbi:hypothetical protein LIER_09629 [Lithospermum erythrorhizon]|uniref:Uncharacterized protein n=1 Tax=Lithospermum erythrorhizon TaxID=34254 RepID=A0AAV3PGG2_LITER
MTPATVTVDLSSSETHSNTGMGLHGEPSVPLQVELSQPFPPRGKLPDTEKFQQREGKAIALPGYSGKYLPTPFQIPNLEITDDAPWTSRKFHYHLAKPMLSKKMAAWYRTLQNPYAAVNGLHVWARRYDRLARVNHSLEYQIRCARKGLAHNRRMLVGMDHERSSLKLKTKKS